MQDVREKGRHHKVMVVRAIICLADGTETEIMMGLPYDRLGKWLEPYELASSALKEFIMCDLAGTWLDIVAVKTQIGKIVNGRFEPTFDYRWDNLKEEVPA
jgi:hypothetical protein